MTLTFTDDRWLALDRARRAPETRDAPPIERAAERPVHATLFAALRGSRRRIVDAP